MRRLFISVVVIGSLGGSYFLLNPEESQTDSALESTIKNQTTQQKNLVEFFPVNQQSKSASQIIGNHSQEKEDAHSLDLKNLLADPMANKAIISENIAEIAKCSSCLELLKATLLRNKLSRDELSELASVLISGNHPEIAKLLLSTATQMMLEFRNAESADTIISVLTRFDSPKVADAFARSISEGFSGNSAINEELESTLQKTINLMTSRQTIGDNLANLYLSTNNANQREKLLAIQQPESLVQISLSLSKQGDSQNAESILMQLQNNPSPYTADALLKLAQSDSSYSTQSSNVIKLATNWAEQYAKNDALDLMENTLLARKLSNSEENLMITMLQHSSDERAQVIVSKYISSKNQKN